MYSSSTSKSCFPPIFSATSLPGPEAIYQPYTITPPSQHVTVGPKLFFWMSWYTHHVRDSTCPFSPPRISAKVLEIIEMFGKTDNPLFVLFPEQLFFKILQLRHESYLCPRLFFNGRVMSTNLKWGEGGLRFNGCCWGGWVGVSLYSWVSSHCTPGMKLIPGRQNRARMTSGGRQEYKNDKVFTVGLCPFNWTQNMPEHQFNLLVSFLSTGM